MCSVCVRSVARMVCYALRPWACLGSETMLKCLFLWCNAFQLATSVHSAHASFLWSPYGIGQTIIFSVCSSSFFFPRLISAAADWMSAILPHMVWT